MTSLRSFDCDCDKIAFNLTNSLVGNIICTSHMQDCPLCCMAKHTFYCKACVNNGDYFRSASTYAER